MQLVEKIKKFLYNIYIRKRYKMTRKEKIKIAQKLVELEQQCQQGNNISENLQTMDELIKSLCISDLMELDSYMEENFEKLNQKYLKN